MSSKPEDVTQQKKKELEDLLDACLDELDDSDTDSCDGDVGDDSDSVSGLDDNGGCSPAHCNDDGNTNTRTTSSSVEKRPVFGPPRPPSMQASTAAPSQNSSESTHKGTHQQLGTGKQVETEKETETEEEKALKEMMRQMEHLFPATTTADTGAFGPGNSDVNKETNDNPSMDKTVQMLLQQLSETNGDNDIGDSDMEGMDEMMRGMQQQWEDVIKQSGAGGDSGPGTASASSSTLNGEEQEVMGQVMDGMMKQLLSKEFMYEPMKDICERFPSWLAENKDSLSPNDYQKYGKQYQYFQKIVHLYDHDPDNTARLTEYMNSLQEYGQPPPDLVSELAPDL
eukprot:CAMPEP_0204617332 /NCGR_PEP_ID=MMETSP0717-20131115/4336_1 /ASSEMBLY_ACC=CAM_ASM_000666 /TAXON_ID=230516 /ORGANISM="Chaetoceros curvisetus" /LENGTH=339 /DNA_ID=CAMNT_0051630831 /DNA_START=17 /DNA_END=1033 /DNA_ORIENTATION=+